VLAGAAPSAAWGDTLVTRDSQAGSYVRADGGTDTTMQRCSTGRRTQNEPSVAVDPTNPDVVVGGANDYCAEITSGSGGTWVGYYRSTDGGANWTDSLVPGYPADTSADGLASPVKGVCGVAGDPTQAFDGGGTLYYGFICFNRAKPQNGGVYVARYDDHGATYAGTKLVEPGTPSTFGLFQDKINLAVDQSSGGPTSGNVYVAWARYSGAQVSDVILFSRSTDGGQTFSRPARIANGPGELQFTDVAVGPDGAVYVTYRAIGKRSAQANAIWIVKSTDGGRTFGAPRGSTPSTRPTTAPTPAATAPSSATAVSPTRASRACPRWRPTTTGSTSSGAPGTPPARRRSSRATRRTATPGPTRSSSTRSVPVISSSPT
jgi:hypothetical protein